MSENPRMRRIMRNIRKVIDNERLPVVYNVNFGHATPRCALQYGAMVRVDMKERKIEYL